ncbi:MAG: hypothetical protein P8X73_06615 [Ignavibacteriaceae bacterium]
MFKNFILVSLAGFLLINCLEKVETINRPTDSISHNKINDVWTLQEINYSEADSTVIIYPEEITLSITFKFWMDNTGQMSHFQKGVTDICNFQ